MLGFAIHTFRYSHMDLFSYLGCLVCGILSFVFLTYSNAFLIFWHSHKCTFSYLYFSQLGCPSFTKYQFCLSLFCHSQLDVPSFVCLSFTSLQCQLHLPPQLRSILSYSGRVYVIRRYLSLRFRTFRLHQFHLQSPSRGGLVIPP